MVGERIELVARHDSSDEMVAYARLPGDDIKGDATLFARGDGVEAAGHVVQPILDIAMPLHEYELSTWGPREADRLIEGGWHNPQIAG